ncbi:hypothetical protein V3I01_09775 [Sphingomonas sp. gentR]|jgi:hypothetical protein|uniref:hypothetical protein n=1 Tax=Sphingomonas sp. gentR TaxID=3118768 RepID=UPI0030CE4EA6
MHWAEHKAVFFVEGSPRGASVIAPIDTKIDGWFSQSQLKSLDTVKDAMVEQVVRAGGNAVIDFKYGQKSSFWRSLLSVDDVYWFASGKIASITPSMLTQR